MTERRLAVLGSPIAHSLSPAIHRAAYRELGLDWRYDAIEVEAGRLAEFVQSCGSEWRGLSVTMPLKPELLAAVPAADDVARESGQANTLLFDRGRRRVFNTDVGGIVRTLGNVGLDRARRVVILGGGATASSALLASEALTAGDPEAGVQVAVRSPERVRDRGLQSRRAVPVEILAIADADLADADVVIATIPGGVDLGLDVPPLTPEQTLLDAVYDPWPTPLAAAWSDAGGRVLRGTEMLVEQALLQVRIFVSGDPARRLPDEARVIGAMRAAVEGS